MTSVCISNCVKDTRVPIRATYVNLYKWPESDAEFVKTVSSTEGNHPKVVDSISCRQLYLRSYTFSRKESVPERTKKALGRVRKRVVVVAHGRRRVVRGGRRRCVVVRRIKEFSCAALSTIFQRLLSCSASVDVVDHTN